MKKILIIEMIVIALISSILLKHFIKPKNDVVSTHNVKQAEEMMQQKIVGETKNSGQMNQAVNNQGVTESKVSKENQEIKDAKTTEKNKQEGSNTAEKGALTGKIICIDAGHQIKGNSDQEPIGPGSLETKAKVSSGTKGVATGKYEYALNLEVALKLKAELTARGATVYMVRETNEVDISNKERAELANHVNADLSLRIHADGSDNSSVNGFSILVPGGNFVSQEVIAESYTIGTYMEKSLSEHIANTSRGIITRGDLSGFNWSKVPAVLVEMGFMSNPEEDQRMSTENFQENLVSALADALEAYYSENEIK